MVVCDVPRSIAEAWMVQSRGGVRGGDPEISVCGLVRGRASREKLPGFQSLCEASEHPRPAI